MNFLAKFPHKSKETKEKGMTATALTVKEIQVQTGWKNILQSDHLSHIVHIVCSVCKVENILEHQR